MRKDILVTLLISLFPVIAIGQESVFKPLVMEKSSDYYLVNWQTYEGLPQNSVNDVVQTFDGHIWLATYGGLVRFDGLNFKTYHIGNSRGLESNRLSSSQVKS
ncbi:MAG: two-component regulator propeller domain-containing protein [Bacteroidota bacterium]